MTYVITSTSVDIKDMSCIEECPVDCTYEGDRKLHIQPAECIDCGACEPVCPVDAIYPDRRLPADKVDDEVDDAAFFAEVLPGREALLGAPGGSLKTGEIGVDTPRIAGFGKPDEG